MDSEQNNELIREQLKEKFKGQKEVVCRTPMRYPMQAEREYQRIAKSFMNEYKRELQKELPKIIKLYQREVRKDSRFDSMQYFEIELDAMFEDMKNRFMKKSKALKKLLQKTGLLALTYTTSELNRMIKNTFGINIYEDYYKGDFYKQMVEQWVDENVSMITTLPGQSLEEMKAIILDGFSEGKTIDVIKEEIQARYNVSENKAKFWARDQMGNLSAQITKSQFQDAGITKYVWRTCHDERVRPCHRALDGKVFEVGNPPEMWYDTKRGRVYTGRRCAPQEDYQCRCQAIPVTDLDTLNIYVAKE